MVFETFEAFKKYYFPNGTADVESFLFEWPKDDQPNIIGIDLVF